MAQCHCGQQAEYTNCCGRFIDGDEHAGGAEQLMRSRYSAFVEKNLEYLNETHDPQTRIPADLTENGKFANAVKFTGLEILKSEESGNKGRVEFIASFTDLKSGEAQKHHELSQFRKQGGIWFYRQGKMIQQPTKD